MPSSSTPNALLTDASLPNLPLQSGEPSLSFDTSRPFSARLVPPRSVLPRPGLRSSAPLWDNDDERTQLATHLRERFLLIRQASVALTSSLSAEDQQVQSMPDVSPTKWHLGHTTWFFEQLVLRPSLEGYAEFHPRFNFLFNSYYETLGPRQPRPQRGLLTRPSLLEVHAYRRAVNVGMLKLFAKMALAEPAWCARWAERVELGLQHEQQHQELMLMDIKHVLGTNPLAPPFREPDPASSSLPAVAEDVSSAKARPLRWVTHAGGIQRIGKQEAGFAYDNEGPQHQVFLEEFALADRLVTNGEFLEFIADGGYQRPTLWLSDGWLTVQEAGWTTPLYWQQREGRWYEYTLCEGLIPLRREAPVVHVSYYEAEAYARWRKKRLPTEAEWEVIARRYPLEGHLVESGELHPRAAAPSETAAPAQLDVAQIYGDVWEWTCSPYTPYPGFRAAEGAIGEYNGKFMSSQMVLRGGSCITAANHLRPSYRNFFPPHARWAFGGIRLAR